MGFTAGRLLPNTRKKPGFSLSLLFRQLALHSPKDLQAPLGSVLVRQQPSFSKHSLWRRPTHSELQEAQVRVVTVY